MYHLPRKRPISRQVGMPNAPPDMPSRNPEKFPSYYMFEWNVSELQDLRSKILISNLSFMNRKPTKVFSERGLYMYRTQPTIWPAVLYF